MLDFVIPETIEKTKKISPAFSIIRRKDLMTKGGKFEAFYNEKTNLWCDDIIELCEQIDDKLEEEENRVNQVFNGYKYIPISISSTHKWDDFVKYVKNLNDKFVTLNPKITFADQETKREDYVMNKLDYVMAPGDYSAWDTLVSRLYTPEDKQKIEWAIGALISGDSRKIQKCIFIEGQPGKGKSTIFEIMQNMFPYYYTAFKAESLGNEADKFALSSFARNPLFAIDADAKLSNMTATNRMNQVIGHDKMCVEEKFKAPYTMRITTMLFMASNYKMNITSSQSGMMRRTIFIKPTENTFPRDEYDDLMRRIEFEYGAICDHCLEVYLSMGPAYYDNYKDKRLIGESNDVYNFLKDNYIDIVSSEYVTVNALWTQFRVWLEQNSTVAIPHKKLDFENDIRNYFDCYTDRKFGAYKVLEGFRTDMFEFSTYDGEDEVGKTDLPDWLNLVEDISVDDNILNKEYAKLLAQEANDSDHPKQKWDNVTTKLKDIDTTKVHYVLPPEKHVVLDFDKKDKDGNKNLELNLEAAKIFPETYAEVSKGGAGLHLHYIYEGDTAELNSLFGDNIEILTFKGKKALRRRLSLCNNHPIAVLKEGQLPKKEVKEVAINKDIVINEKALRSTIAKCLNKEVHADSTSNINFIFEILEKAYHSGVDYDVSDLKQAVLVFAKNSSKTKRGDLSNIKTVGKMHFCSQKFELAKEDSLISTNSAGYFDEEAPTVFFDVEVFPNLFVICWKKRGEKECISWINPGPELVKGMFAFRLIGFNNRDYDNHIIYAASMGYSVKGLYDLSQRIINGDKEVSKNAKFGEAYNLSYTDIYDFAAAHNKMSLKKWEIKLKIRHLELGLPWDEPVPEELWPKVAEYCCNDVDSTEKLFEHLQGDFVARKILARLAGGIVNDTTNQLTTKLLVGDRKNPQSEYVYTDLSKEFPGYEYNQYGFKPEDYKPGTKIISGKSRYVGEDPGEGGYKIAYYGYYENVALLDIASMHPSSAIALNVFGDEITQRFKNIVYGRVAVKHVRKLNDEAYNEAVELLGPIIDEYFRDGLDAGSDIRELASDLADALKTAINSVYGLTSAAFPNKLRDPRNKDNIVAKRGALFMLTLKHKLLDMGVKIAHISTDSIKVANATTEIIEFVMNFGKQYGYTFEHEATYSKMCIVNDAVYIAKYASEESCQKMYGYLPSKQKPGKWTATGKQFQVPYVFKTLFSHEEIVFDDFCETMSTTSALYLVNPVPGTDVTQYHFVGRVGEFTPVNDDGHGSELLRLAGKEEDGTPKYAAATGTKGYLWLESEVVRSVFADPMTIVDISYYDKLVEKAIDAIEEYIPFDEFVGDETRAAA